MISIFVIQNIGNIDIFYRSALWLLIYFIIANKVVGDVIVDVTTYNVLSGTLNSTIPYCNEVY